MVPGHLPLPYPAMRIERRLFWIILILLSLASFFNYFDRQTLSVLKTTLKAEFAMDDAAYARLVNVFTGCYAIAYVASGWVVDQLGPRASLTAFMALWSMATIGCGLARSFWQLATLRGLLGLAEPGFFPVMIRTATVWAEDKGRGVFMSLASVGSSLATIVAVPIVVWLTVHFHWRVAFVLPGLGGLGAALIWWLVYREPPARLVSIGTAGLEAAARVDSIPWRKLWGQRSLWGVVLCRLASDPVWYFCVFWMPGYLQEHKGVSLEKLGLVGWMPFLAGNLGGLGFAAVSDRCARDYGVKGRKYLVMATAVFGPASLIIPYTSSLALTVAIFCVMTTVCSAWLGSLGPIIAELFPVGNVAGVWGIAGAFGAVGAMIFNYFVGQVSVVLGVERLFWVMAILHPCAALIMHVVLRRPVTPQISPAFPKPVSS